MCSELDCTTPLPDQRDLGDTGENDCQKAIGKAGVKHLLKVEKILEKCGSPAARARAASPTSRSRRSIDKSEQKLEDGIRNKCGNRDPAPSVPFCCRTGVGNMCTAVATREDCEMIPLAAVRNNQECGMDGTCDPIPGQQKLTWWGTCPVSDTCPGTPLTTLDDLIACVDTTVDEITDSCSASSSRAAGALPARRVAERGLPRVTPVTRPGGNDARAAARTRSATSGRHRPSHDEGRRQCSSLVA